MQDSVDLNIALPALVPGCRFLLSKSVPPHKIIEWRGPGTQPTQKDIEAWWATYTPLPQRASFEERISALEVEIKSLKEATKL
jgi:hypothetical protein